MCCCVFFLLHTLTVSPSLGRAPLPDRMAINSSPMLQIDALEEVKYSKKYKKNETFVYWFFISFKSTIFDLLIQFGYADNDKHIIEFTCLTPVF